MDERRGERIPAWQRVRLEEARAMDRTGVSAPRNGGFDFAGRRAVAAENEVPGLVIAGFSAICGERLDQTGQVLLGGEPIHREEVRGRGEPVSPVRGPTGGLGQSG